MMPVPIHITLHKKSRVLEVIFDNGEKFNLACDYLRAHSPSADKQPSSATHVNIVAIEPVGNYAIKPIFSDGHATGIYSWETLYKLAKQER